MANVKKNLIGTRVEKGEYRVHLVLRWRETCETDWRRFQAETFRVAGRVCECSMEERWVVGADTGCNLLGHGMLATMVTVELADGDAGEKARAVTVLEAVARNIRG